MTASPQPGRSSSPGSARSRSRRSPPARRGPVDDLGFDVDVDADPSSTDTPAHRVLRGDFTACWDRGERLPLEAFLHGRAPLSAAQMADLAFQEFGLRRELGLDPRPEEYLARFPDHAGILGQLFDIDREAPLAPLRLCKEADPIPVAGDRVGRYHLIRDLGAGSFSRVFLAEENDLEDRLVVVKVTTDLADDPPGPGRRSGPASGRGRLPEHRLLARAGHPNIVEVLSHSQVSGTDLRIICMPFLGGATLTQLLDERRRRHDRPRSGADLLADLDRVAAPEYAPPGASRPSRELIERLSYPRAAAWIVARLADALDFAYRRRVLHGDVKPSNVLLTAEAVPMLLDFNLSVDWLPSETSAGAHALPDEGGTMAYMAPERLAVLHARQEAHAAELGLDEAEVWAGAAADDPEPDPAELDRAGRELAAAESGLARLRLSAPARHQADVYSLGVVLMELLTGRPPEVQVHPGAHASALRHAASSYFTSRRRGAGARLRVAGGPVPAGLRAILARCLAPDPSDRYRRASELAHDLDCWRTDRPLAHARDPLAGFGLLRWARRQRLALSAGLVGLILALGGAAVAWRTSEAMNRGKSMLFYQIAGSWDSGAFAFRRQRSERVNDPGDRALIARRHLMHFHVFGPGDWRLRPEFVDLPEFERQELEAWLLEQSLRFARALAERPDSPDDWRRALALLENVAATTPGGALDRHCRALRTRLGLDPSPPGSPTAATAAAPAPWLEAYLAGVDAELRQADAVGADSSASGAAALSHYRRALELRPGAFWANYRAASVAFHARDYDAAVGYLRRCVGRCPDNPILRLLLAGCLQARASDEPPRSSSPRPGPSPALERAEALAEAAAQCDKAQALDPDFAETYLTRSFLRLGLGQAEESRKDFLHFEMLTGQANHAAIPGRDALEIAPAVSVTPPERTPTGGRSIGSDESNIRAHFARALGISGRLDLALAELDRALELDPDMLRTRYVRGYLRDRSRDDRSVADFARVVADPRYDDFVASAPDAVFALERLAYASIVRGAIPEAVAQARRGVALADRHRHRRAELHFTLAVALAYAGEADPALCREAYGELRLAHDLDARLVADRLPPDGPVGSLVAEFGPLGPARP